MAKTLYVTQSGAGLADGSSLGNAWSVASLNTSGNWGVGAGKVSPGDTVSLNGTFSSSAASPVIIQGGGTIGNPITILFASGAKFSAATWTTGTTTGLISLNSKSYITIDGGTNGLIEATDNGQFLTFQNGWVGISAISCDNLTIQNLTIRNMYVRTFNDPNVLCDSITLFPVLSNTTVSNCSFTYAFTSCFANFGGTTGTNFTYTNNSTTYCGSAVLFNDAGASNIWSGFTFSNNFFDHCDVWGDVADTVHSEGFRCSAVNGGSSAISGITAANNYFGPFAAGAHTTAYIFLEGNITGSPLIYNNVFVQASAGAPSNGAIYNKNSATTNVYNNTFTSDGSGLGINALATGVIAKNNIVNDLDIWFLTSTATCDYNDLYSVNTSSATEGGHSIITNPTLNGTYGLTAGSPCIGTGVDLSGTFTTDKNGVTRTVPWDMGAYKFGASVTQAIKRIGRYLRLHGLAN